MTEYKKYRYVEWQPTSRQLDSYYGTNYYTIKTEKNKNKKGENNGV